MVPVTRRSLSTGTASLSPTWSRRRKANTSSAAKRHGTMMKAKEHVTTKPYAMRAKVSGKCGALGPKFRRTSPLTLSPNRKYAATPMTAENTVAMRKATLDTPSAAGMQDTSCPAPARLCSSASIRLRTSMPPAWTENWSAKREAPVRRRLGSPRKKSTSPGRPGSSIGALTSSAENTSPKQTAVNDTTKVKTPTIQTPLSKATCRNDLKVAPGAHTSTDKSTRRMRGASESHGNCLKMSVRAMR
mmetsp:Transcript_97500/g.209178  ORF Transcript_97500/g.209178 Transcript_97500/m.209178 type:complete len:245 (+) Transcript_97500:308-1042(+)